MKEGLLFRTGRDKGQGLISGAGPLASWLLSASISFQPFLNSHGLVRCDVMVRESIMDARIDKIPTCPPPASAVIRVPLNRAREMCHD